MFRRLLLGAALAAAALPALAQNCTPRVPDSELSKPRTLVLSTNPTLPPMQFVNAQGQLVGMRVELGAEIAKRLCLAVENVRIEFAAMIPGLAARRWDMINTGMFYTEDRAKLMYLVRYEEQAISISVPRGNPRNIRRLEDLAGPTVGVEQGGFEFRRTQDIATELTGEVPAPHHHPALRQFRRLLPVAPRRPARCRRLHRQHGQGIRRPRRLHPRHLRPVRHADQLRLPQQGAGPGGGDGADRDARRRLAEGDARPLRGQGIRRPLRGGRAQLG